MKRASLCKTIYIVVLLMGLQACKSSLIQNNQTITQTKIDSNIKADESILKYYEPYKRALDSQMSSVLVVSSVELTKGQPESNLSNLFSDAIATTCKNRNVLFDFALPTTNGGIRTNLPKGDITLRSAFELMPFENELVVL